MYILDETAGLAADTIDTNNNTINDNTIILLIKEIYGGLDESILFHNHFLHFFQVPSVVHFALSRPVSLDD